MTKKKKVVRQILPEVNGLTVLELILMDHFFIKECIDVLTSDHTRKPVKLSKARVFLDALNLHTNAEKRAVYAPLKTNEELHFNILEAEIEHAMIEKKIKSLKLKLNHSKILKDEVEAELKVLAELVKLHVMEEESEMLPKMKEALPDYALEEIGQHFMKLRKFSSKELQAHPDLVGELIEWNDSIKKVSRNFLSKMDKVVENMQH